jgi:glycosyltransferase involved in cell wall biosynthesis
MNGNNTSPCISVIIVSYNFEKFLKECIESVLSQTLRPFEIIICDDCSQDNSPSIIKKYKDKYPNLIKAYIQSKNLGPAKNGNFALSAVTGDLVSWMDGDDRWLPKKLEYEWAALCANPQAKIAYSNVYQIDANGNRIQKWYRGNRSALPVGDVFIQTYSRNFFPDRKSLFRNYLFYRSCYEKIGFFDINLASFWDWDEKIRLTSNYLIAYSGKALVEYRVNPDGISKINSKIHLQAFKDVYEKHLHLLKNKNLEEKAQVQVRLETIVALRQYKMSTSNLDSKYSIGSVFQRDLLFLKKLKKNRRIFLLKNNRKILDKLMKCLIEDNISEGHLFRAFWYQLMFLNCEFNMPKSISTSFFKIIKYIFKNNRGN